MWSGPLTSQHVSSRGRQFPFCSVVTSVSWRSLFLAESLESVEEQVQRELELELVVATWANDRLSLVGGRAGYLHNIGVPLRHLPHHDRHLFGLESSTS